MAIQESWMTMQTVHLFVCDTLADWETGYAIAGINRPAFQLHPGQFQVKTVGATTEPVITMGGMRILPDLSLDDLDPLTSAMLILPGADTWDEGGNAEAARKAGAFLDAGVPVAAICGATAGLAREGVLDNRRHTSNACAYLQATGYRGEAHYADEPAVTDGTLITAAATAPVDFAYHIFKRLGVYDDQTLNNWYALFKGTGPTGAAAAQDVAAK
jgi:putative intracellular protease/amidase